MAVHLGLGRLPFTTTLCPVAAGSASVNIAACNPTLTTTSITASVVPVTTVSTSSTATAFRVGSAAHRRMHQCVDNVRRHGDSVWLQRRKLRLQADGVHVVRSEHHGSKDAGDGHGFRFMHG